MTICPSGKLLVFQLLQQLQYIHAARTFNVVLITNRHWSLSVCTKTTDFLKINLNVNFLYMFRCCSLSVPLRVLTLHFVITCFRNEVYENCVLLGCYSVSSGNLLPTFWDEISVHLQGSITFYS